jgi:DNA mismatch repair protein MutL
MSAIQETDAQRVHVLPPDVVHQIAAGEVVERPASVVKELVENSLDAGARQIDVVTEGGGLSLVRVVDDGCGMSPQDAMLALRHHATSKLRRVDDLVAIGSFGFRGEALPAIASVSRFSLVTRPRAAEAGVRLEVDGGGEPREQVVGCPAGTTVDVRDLFFNTPARRKFMKSAPSELGQITEVMSLLALASPEVAMRLVHEDRVLLRVEGDLAMGDRVRRVVGSALGRHLLEWRHEEGTLGLHAFLAPPMVHVGSAQKVRLFVNGRAVRDRTISHALLQAYRTLMPAGRHPVAVVFLHVRGHDVDVNVHPQKTEVRFAAPSDVHQAVRHAIDRFLRAGPWVDSPAPADTPIRKGGTPRAPRPVAPHSTDVAELPLVTPRPAFPPGLPHSYASAPAPSPPATAEAPHGRFSRLRYIGQLHAMYLLCQSRDRLVVIDQHAAHERVNFEHLRAAWRAGRPASQALLMPQVLELTPAQDSFLTDNSEILVRIGFMIEPFGPGAWAVKAAPAVLGAQDARRLLHDVVEECMDGGTARTAEAAVEHVLATLACHASVRGEHAMSPEEARALLAAMDEVDCAVNCPHGRPVVVELSRAEVERWFHRR